MVWRNVDIPFDPLCCPNCGARMRLARIDARPVRRFEEFERHIYRCDDCANISRFVIDKQSWAERRSA
ncbi:hypothetical protein OO17_23920 [Rhodopseudomonas palustris]|uniref:Uncharacterized protein n=1 Tax=Rhodopseudomonas palustris TaxID=1076 RepID=A0A0D7E8E4_RHOPL|nr:hypothetical protein OO17_23920 [Rhodopseudomonas palustris]